MKRITVNIEDVNYEHVQKLMKQLDITESEAVEYFIEKDRLKLFFNDDIKIIKGLIKE